ncbi:MAG: hypothetical protein HPY75_02615 [Actinobacteria bacterium]|nr:hypothetical protein [Actinomycetota bacterium]
MRAGGRRRNMLAIAVALLLALALSVTACTRGAAEGDLPGSESDGEVTRNAFSFLVCGDPHARTDLLQKIVDQALPGEFLVITGDISTGKGLDEMREMKRFLDGTGLEYHVIPGDNDMPRGDTSTFTEVFGPDHFYLDIQDARLVFVNDAVAGIGCPDDQLAWLEDTLAGLEGKKTVIGFAHVPPGAPLDVGRGGFQPRETESAREMLDILADAGAPVLYCGHIHAYMLYSSGPPRVVVSGGAGANPHLSEESGGFHHFLRVTVRGGEVSEEVIPL